MKSIDGSIKGSVQQYLQDCSGEDERICPVQRRHDRMHESPFLCSGSPLQIYTLLHSADAYFRLPSRLNEQ